MIARMIRQTHSVPRSVEEIMAAAARVGIPVLDDCMAGVVANLELLARHAEILLDGSDMAE
jgi:hypothetical protein